MKQRLDKILTQRGLTQSRSQAENFIRLGKVEVNGRIATKTGVMVGETDTVSVTLSETYVSRAGLKLASVTEAFAVDFRDKTVLDIGSSTGGFTDYALKHGAKKVYAVDVGTNQLHSSLVSDERIELYEKTDIRDFRLEEKPDVIVGDVSFISMRDILPHVAKELMSKRTILVAMLKPQFEAGKDQVNKGVIKNNAIRRQILTDFEEWAHRYFTVLDKRDSDVAGAKGNFERFYKLKLR